MPHLTIEIGSSGPVLTVGVGVSESLRELFARAGQSAPPQQIAHALIDTGASRSVVDPSIIEPLGLRPTAYMPFHTPSTRGVPVKRPVYDLSIWLHHEKSKYIFERSFPVACLELKPQGCDMLIGRDILGECLLVDDGPGRRFSLAF